MYNCLFDCKYCFLQGMYSSANYVIFVNYEDYYDEIKKISMKSGGLLLFNGKNSMHRVTKVNCDEIRMLAVLAYNDKPGVSLSKSAQMTFYGRTDG